MRQSLTALTALLLAGCATVPAAQAPLAPANFEAAPLAARTPSDLPRSARPLHYSIAIDPDAENLAFDGTSSVTMEVYEPVEALVLHALDLDIGRATLSRAGSAGNRPMRITYDEANQTAHFADGAAIAPGTYRLDTVYSGTINTQAAGLFALDYPDRRTGETTRSLFTQFEAPDARRFAPMFDEPSYKATFELTATVDPGQMAVSNMPIAAEQTNADGTRRVVFQQTPVMSSYLLFFALGDFERAAATAADGTEVGIVAPAGSGAQAQYALDSLVPLIPFYEEYFGVEYPLPKLDNVAAPGSSQFFGAMENWGAILTFERILLDDPTLTSAAARQSIYSVQAHEVSHQWFGNIVTMAWWDDLWLNEGFASWLETKTTHHFNPEWGADIGRVDVREAAMGLDGFASTHPVIQPIETVAETAQAFDAIAYSKGEAVIGMLEDYAGEDVWQRGLQTYIARHSYANSRNTDLWRAMEEAGAEGLTAIAEDFTTQPGIPLVRADGRCENGRTLLALAQSEFSRDRQDAVAQGPQDWLVPMHIGRGGAADETVVLQGQHAMTLPGCAAPVVVNQGQLGYFRTLYSEELSGRIEEGFATLAPIDQLGLMRDGFALAQSGYQDWARPLDLLEAVPGNAHARIADYAVESWAGIYGSLAEEREAERATIAAIARDAWLPRLRALGYDPVDGEQVVDTNLRASLITSLAAMGDEAVAAEARRRFALLATNPRALDGPSRLMWLSIAAANAGEVDWDLLSRLARESTSATERAAYFERLGSASDEALARRALAFALSGEAGTSSATIIRAVAGRHPELAYDFVMENREGVRALVDPSGWQGYIAGIAASSNDPDQLARLIAYRDSLPEDEAIPLTRTIDAITTRVATRPLTEAAILAWLASR